MDIQEEQTALVPEQRNVYRGARKKRHKFGFKEFAFWFIGIITLIYVIFELGVAVWKHSLTLLSDGFHNLSDVLALVIAYWSAVASKRDLSDSMSYGWARTEILGALINGTFLISLCLYVMLEAIPEYIQPSDVESGWYFVIVAAAGLVVNTVGTIVFAFTGHAHSHSHGGGGHSHGGGGHSHGGDDHGHAHGEEGRVVKKRDMNVYAVFIHYLGDAVSSLLVLGGGLLIEFFPDKTWVKYIDPTISVVIVVLILVTTFPLVKSCAYVMLQSSPPGMSLSHIRHELKLVPGIVDVHDLHAWQLVDGMVICSVHVVCRADRVYAEILADVRRILHKHGIHSSTVQPEVVEEEVSMQEIVPVCVQNCIEECDEDWCCKTVAERVTEESQPEVKAEQYSTFSG